MQNSVVGAGSIVKATAVSGSVIFTDVVIEAGAVVRNCVVMPGSRINRGRGPQRDPDKNVVVAKGAQLGVDLTRDRERYSVSDGIVTIGKGIVVD